MRTPTLTRPAPDYPGSLRRRASGLWTYRIKINGQLYEKALRTRDWDEAVSRGRKEAESFSVMEAESKRLTLIGLFTPEEAITKAAAASTGILLCEAFDRYESSPKKSVNSHTELNRRRNLWEKLTSWCFNRQLTYMHEVTSSLAESYASGIKEGLANRTYKSYVVTARQVFKVVCPELPNPFKDIHIPQEYNESHRDLSDAEIALILDVAQGEWKTMILMGAFTGLRLKDCALMNWSCVDMTTNMIRTTPAKTRRSSRILEIPIHSDLREPLDRIPFEERAGDVFPELAAVYRDGLSGLSAQFRELAESVGIQTRETVEGRKKSVCRVGFPSLRHSFVTTCLRARVPRAFVEEIVGHSSTVVNRVYSHLGTEAAIATIKALPSVSQEEVEKGSLSDLIRALDGATDSDWRLHWKPIRTELLQNGLAANVQKNARPALTLQ